MMNTELGPTPRPDATTWLWTSGQHCRANLTGRAASCLRESVVRLARHSRKTANKRGSVGGAVGGNVGGAVGGKAAETAEEPGA